LPLAALAFAVLWRARFGGAGGADAMSRRGPIDWAGAALLAGALVCALLAMRGGLGDGDAGPRVMLAFGAVALAAGWFAVERRALDPVLPLALFANPSFSAGAWLAAASGVALFAAVAFLPHYLQSGLLLSPSASALYLLPLMLGLTIAARISGRALRTRG